ncbi:uncharacterized protein L969DRAFT_94765 [Mixia osmundae IAM 14324]|uniref:DNA damage-binding protein 1 n=1 Tax=Mixia osmundae (strain CBS 9802 / IAM 14324 / JCM 22182 / KY 12970) TaxID=764103 RepID=G7E464_MIXOS|nr:uncharacterized protein L969DRAFT_94765 [Mixia osmundae IAM 14324]KEI39720.1 hypothetical protein L969DRAFT_94765 [Mixia osmundae IAM 14324]GAA97624.1 hypothetical protein E5Q_04302 [Mixia osmundae IAM 14324]
MQSYCRQVLPPSGVEHAVSLKLTGTCVEAERHSTRVVRNLVVARSNFLQVYEVLEEPVPVQSSVTDGSSASMREDQTRLQLLAEHVCHGIVTGLARLSTLDTRQDGRHRLVISFRDAKMTVMEWSDQLHDLAPVSMHSFERLPQLSQGDLGAFQAVLRVDQASRCVALLLPDNTLGILPFFQDLSELEDMTREGLQSLPYAPSLTIDLSEIGPGIRNVVDFAFLPGFSEPTIAILFQRKPTWTGRIDFAKDITSLVMVTLDIGSRNYPVIFEADGLPYDALSLSVCPRELGGVVILCANSLVHIDQSSKMTGIAVNGWTSTLTDARLDSRPTLRLVLEGAQCAFVGQQVAVLCTRTGETFSLHLEKDGRNVSSMDCRPRAVTCIPACIETVGAAYVFVGSAQGQSVLLRWASQSGAGADILDITESGTGLVQSDAMDDDLYATAGAHNGNGHQIAPTGKDVQLELCDTLPGYGTIRHIAVLDHTSASLDEPSLVACTGVQAMAGLTTIHRHVPSVRQVDLDLPTARDIRHIWTVGLEQRQKMGRGPITHQIICSTGSSSMVYTLDQDTQAATLARKSAEVPLAAGSFFSRSQVLEVTEDMLRLYSPDGQITTEAPHGQADAIDVTVSDPFVAVLSAARNVTVFFGDPTTSLLNELGQLPIADVAAVSLVAQANKGMDRHLIAAALTNGEIIVYSLPDMQIQWQSESITQMPPVLRPRYLVPTSVSGKDHPDDTTMGEAGDEVSAMLLTVIDGLDGVRLHLVALLGTSRLVVYELVRQHDESRSVWQFVRRIARQLPIGEQEEEQSRRLVSFISTTGRSGVFITGSAPFYLLTDRAGIARLYRAPYGRASAFGAFDPPSSTPLLVLADGAMHTYDLSDQASLARELPVTHVATSKCFTSTAYHDSSHTLVAARVVNAPFELFDDEGAPVYRAPSEDMISPTVFRSCLELLVPGSWDCIDGHEFPQNESILQLICATLPSATDPSGRARFVIASTCNNRGEDLQTRGGLYVFRISTTESTAASDQAQARSAKLSLVHADDLRHPVGAICEVNGHIIHSLGQKVFIKAFDSDQRLITVGFLDVGLDVSAMRSIKNLLIIGDSLTGTYFVAFQEDPFKLVLLGKEARKTDVYCVDFLVQENRLGLLSVSRKGLLRQLEYNPGNAESRAGERLLDRTEYHLGKQIIDSLSFAKRLSTDEDLRQSGVMLVGADGSLTWVTPVREVVYRRLALLERQLHRQLPHFAGLNPRAFRTARNDYYSRPLARGMLDGDLLAIYANLHASRQQSLASHINSDPDTLSVNLGNLEPPWA